MKNRIFTLTIVLTACLAGCKYDDIEGDWAYVSTDKDYIVSSPDWDTPKTFGDVEYYPIRLSKRGFFSYEEPRVIYCRMIESADNGGFSLESVDGDLRLEDDSRAPQLHLHTERRTSALRRLR